MKKIFNLFMVLGLLASFSSAYADGDAASSEIQDIEHCGARDDSGTPTGTVSGSGEVRDSQADSSAEDGDDA